MAMLVAAAYLIDLLIGDPRGLTHPVVLIGKIIEILERYVRKTTNRPFGLKAGGVLIASIVVAVVYCCTFLSLYGLKLIHPYLAVGVEIWLISTTISARGLGRAAKDVADSLRDDDLDRARRKVGMIVGRDTENMDCRSVIRATVETVAENTVDGVVAPIFYAFIGGAPLAMAYRAINTLDSMVGYKNEKYKELGWASARLDDLANFLPARISGLLLVAAAWLSRRRADSAWKIMFRDAGGHPSPNSGIMEAGMAGALGIRLGGLNYYGGRPCYRSYMGDGSKDLIIDHIRRAVDLMYMISAMAVMAILTAATLQVLTRMG